MEIKDYQGQHNVREPWLNEEEKIALYGLCQFPPHIFSRWHWKHFSGSNLLTLVAFGSSVRLVRSLFFLPLKGNTPHQQENPALTWAKISKWNYFHPAFFCPVPLPGFRVIARAEFFNRGSRGHWRLKGKGGKKTDMCEDLVPWFLRWNGRMMDHIPFRFFPS